MDEEEEEEEDGEAEPDLKVDLKWDLLIFTICGDMKPFKVRSFDLYTICGV